MSRTLLLTGTLTLLAALSSPAADRDWSVDLRKYGFKADRAAEGRPENSTVEMAANGDVVAVGIGNSRHLESSNQSNNLWNSPWEIRLLFFDARNGKLRAKAGPWTADPFFELHATSQGNFFLWLRHLNDSSRKHGETLLLLSSSGEELKKLEMEPAIGPSGRGWNQFLVSTSGRTVVVGQIYESGVHYRSLAPATLEPKLAWDSGKGSDSPQIVAVSDIEMLGIGAVQKAGSKSLDRFRPPLYLRTFEGTWRPFPVSLDISHRGFASGSGLHPNMSGFLTDELMVTVNGSSEPATAGTAVPVQVLRTHCADVSTPSLPKLPDRTWPTGPLLISADGRYFAVGFRHRPWLAHFMLDVAQMDITFQNDESLVIAWEISSPMPIDRVGLNDGVQALSLVGGDPPVLVVLERTMLRLTRLNSRPHLP